MEIRYNDYKVFTKGWFMACEAVIGIIGVGTIGLAIAYHFGLKNSVIGFDNDPERIKELKKGFDRHKMFTSEELAKSSILFTNTPEDIKKVTFYIVAVPTTFTDGKPNLSHLLKASETIGRYLKKDDIVVYESTVYPGVTEDECIPVLEKTSGLKSPTDFGVGYSPERINPGDKEHNLKSIKKIISGQNQTILERIGQVYEKVIEAGVVPVSTIKVAEATKIVENTQRDVEISFLNEAALILHQLGINSKEVFQAMSTKWNYVKVLPGLVGGSCIGKDSNYLIFKSEDAGYYPNVTIAARHTNDSVCKYIADQTTKLLSKKNINAPEARIGICGVTFKEDYNDTENSRVFDIINELKQTHKNLLIHDPIADAEDVKKKYDVNLVPWDKLNDLDAIIFAVSHHQYRSLTKDEILNKLKKKSVIIDIKNIFDKKDFPNNNICYWQL